MASASDPKKSSIDPACPHLRLILEADMMAQYLTGHYVCEQCGQHFDRPTLKQQSTVTNEEPPSQ
jgi:hypothetical protein